MVVIEAADCTVSGSTSPQATWAVSVPNASTGDLLAFLILWDDSTTTSDSAEPAGPNGETLTEMNATPVAATPGGGTAARMKGWYTKATGSWSAGTITFTPTASESWSAVVIRVPAGEFDATTPIGAIGTRNSTAETDTSILSPEFSAGSSDGGGTLVWFAGVDSSVLTELDSGWTSINTQDMAAIAHGVATRDTSVTNSESISGAAWDIDVADDWASIAFIVRPPEGTSTTVNPSRATLTIAGNAPSITSAFSNVRIREVLVNASGQPVGGATDITLLVWYSGRFGGAPDISLNGFTTDSLGTTSWSIATGSLVAQQPIAYIAQNAVSLSHYACARMIPSYE